MATTDWISIQRRNRRRLAPRCASSRCRCSETHRARVGARPWSWSSAGGSPDALAKAGVALVVLKENIQVGGQARHPDEGHDHHARCAVRRGGARPDLRAHLGRVSPGPGPRAGSSAARSARLASRASMARRTRAGASSNATSAPARWRGFDERVDINCSGVMAPRRRVSPSSRPPRAFGRADPGDHAPAPWPGRVTVRRQRRLAARPVRPQDARRRASATVSGPPPRSSAGSGTR